MIELACWMCFGFALCFSKIELFSLEFWFLWLSAILAVISSKKGLDPSKPVHLFGAGHPLIPSKAQLDLRVIVVGVKARIIGHSGEDFQ